MFLLSFCGAVSCSRVSGICGVSGIKFNCLLWSTGP
jgi:hypothetical protein